MQQSKNWFSIFRALLFAALALFGLTSCFGEPKIKRPPIMVPIKLEKEGVIANFIFEIKEHLIYEYFIRFNFPENDQIERVRVRKLLGGFEVDKSGKVKEPGVPTPLRLTITKIGQPEEKVYAVEVEPILSSWGGNSFDKNIGYCDLPPGKYRLYLENITQSLEFSSIPISFVIGVDKFKFIFDPKKSDRSKSCPQ